MKRDRNSKVVTMSPEIRTLLFMSAANILGMTATYGKSLEQLAQGMRELQAETDPNRSEIDSHLPWKERWARSFDWLTVYERGK